MEKTAKEYFGELREAAANDPEYRKAIVLVAGEILADYKDEQEFKANFASFSKAVEIKRRHLFE